MIAAAVVGVGLAFNAFGAISGAKAQKQQIKAQAALNRIHAKSQIHFANAIKAKNKIRLGMEMKYLESIGTIHKDRKEFLSKMFNVHDSINNVEILYWESKKMEEARENYYGFLAKGMTLASGWSTYQNDKHNIDREAHLVREKNKINAIEKKMNANFEFHAQGLGALISESRLRSSIVDEDMRALQGVSAAEHTNAQTNLSETSGLYRNNMNLLTNMMSTGIQAASLGVDYGTGSGIFDKTKKHAAYKGSY